MASTPPPGTGLPDHNRGPEILAVCGALTAISFLFIVMRLYVRIRITKNAWWDDWLVFSAWVVVFAEMMLFIPEVRYGAGRHAAYIDPPSNISKGLKLNFITQPMCILSITLIKAGIGLFLLRLTPSVVYRRIIQTTVGLTCAVNFAYIVILFNQCKPLPVLWGEGTGKCMSGADLRFATFFNASFGVVTDLVLAFIPIPMLFKLRVNWKLRVAVCCILSLGIFATSAAFVKIYFTNDFGKQGDFLWDSTDLTIWTTVEICVAVIASSIPCLKALFKGTLQDSSYDNTYPLQGRSGYIQQGSNKHTHPGRSKSGEPDFELYPGTKQPGVSITSSRQDKLDPDNISEESFLPSQSANMDVDGGIRRTTQVSVRFNTLGNLRTVDDRV